MNELPWLAIDVLLIGALLVLAVAALHSRHLRQAVILFIAFGLTAALVWARLRAPDVALAEAAIGAGLAGALMLAALRDVPEHEIVGDSADVRAAKRLAIDWVAVLVTVASTLLAIVIGWAVWHGMHGAAGERLASAVADNIDATGVSNPITAVLLNFRALDTLLELAVLLAALLGILALGPARTPYAAAGPVFRGLMTWLVPLLVLAAGYQLWVGAHAPGGAFQAGALLGAAGVIVFLAGKSGAGLPHGIWLRVLSTAGVGVFMLVGLATLWSGHGLLDYRGDVAGQLILLIEVFATLAIAATLILCYVGGEPQNWQSADREETT
jgi:multisubunit Na+/H+ antiporter MnhB subunit